MTLFSVSHLWSHTHSGIENCFSTRRSFLLYTLPMNLNRMNRDKPTSEYALRLISSVVCNMSVVISMQLAQSLVWNPSLGLTRSDKLQEISRNKVMTERQMERIFDFSCLLMQQKNYRVCTCCTVGFHAVWKLPHQA